MRFSHRNRYSSDNLVLENKSLDAFKDPKEDEEDADILDPGKLDGFPEAGPITDDLQGITDVSVKLKGGSSSSPHSPDWCWAGQHRR